MCSMSLWCKHFAGWQWKRVEYILMHLFISFKCHFVEYIFFILYMCSLLLVWYDIYCIFLVIFLSTSSVKNNNQIFAINHLWCLRSPTYASHGILDYFVGVTIVWKIHLICVVVLPLNLALFGIDLWLNLPCLSCQSWFSLSGLVGSVDSGLCVFLFYTLSLWTSSCCLAQLSLPKQKGRNPWFSTSMVNCMAVF